LLSGIRRPRRGLLPAAAALVAIAALATAGSAGASKRLVLGLFDDAAVFDVAHPPFADLRELHVQVLRLTLPWGGPGGVAEQRPANATDPADPAYDWARYDRAIEDADAAGIQVLLTIVGTPAWANGGLSPQHPPSSASTLRRFAFAAASRYSGTFLDPASGRILPRVSSWLAWNEPNNPVFLQPQWLNVQGTWRMVAADAYARICNAVYDGVHAAGGPEQVGCGATAPRGSNAPTGTRPSISPVAFLRAAKAGGLRTFDAWAHHPYYGSPAETPATRPAGLAIGLGNIGTLIAELTRLYGDKPLWITEYGYQTRPPDSFFGVSWPTQAAYVRQAWGIAKANPRIDLFTWFLLRDSPDPNGWQSGFVTTDGKRKPAFAAFADLRGGSL
jgi:hypothetical protein